MDTMKPILTVPVKDAEKDIVICTEPPDGVTFVRLAIVDDPV